MEHKRERFVKLAEARTNKALKDIQLIGNLSNSNAYDYSDEDVRKMFKALQDGLERSKQRFSDASSRGRGSFRL
jgi:CHASE1-domain containing sensor protein